MGTVYGFGNPLMDIITYENFDRIKELQAVPGSMNLVDSEKFKIIRNSENISVKNPGGSCANTLRGIAWLSSPEDKIAPPLYSGAVGKDEAGEELKQALYTLGVEPLLAVKATPTGHSAIIVTPDYERTMFTFLGACRELSREDIHFDRIKEVDFVHIAGYMWDTENQMQAAKETVAFARERNTVISFDIAGPFVAERYHNELKQWIPGNVDMLFANQDELSMITGVSKKNLTEMLEIAGGWVPLVIMKIGKDGCMIDDGGRIFHISGEKVDPEDTIGAGDAFAAGFLYGLLKKKSVEQCAKWANIVASGIVTVEGCNYTVLDKEQLIERLRQC